MRLESEPGQMLAEVWAYLSPEEARDLLASLAYWIEEVEGGQTTVSGIRTSAIPEVS